MPNIEEGTRRESKFREEDLNPNGGTMVILDRSTGEEISVDDADEGGVILRGEDADKYLDGERVAIPGVGYVTKDGGFESGGLVSGSYRENPYGNTMPEDSAAISETAFKRGDSEIDPNAEPEPRRTTTRKAASEPADKAANSNNK
jgi:hypothetical protein